MKKLYISILFLFILSTIYAQKVKTDANIVGHVASEGVHIPFASVAIKGTTIGTVTDETGHFQFIHLPVGELTVVVSVVGYKQHEVLVLTKANFTNEIKFDLVKDVLNLEEVVVSADRSAQKRTEAPVIVNTIPPKLFQTTQSVTLGESLNFSPGLRLENNCQNCGFTQIRMNGLEGPYSQILINSRPIFSGLAGVYGLELIPTNMIERVEVVRGGGSALFGSNAIAGTINIILKDPVLNSYEIGTTYSLTGVGIDGSESSAPDFSVNFNTSIVSADHKSGVTLYGFTRERKMFDANDDGFSELAPINNLTLGTRIYHRFSLRSKVAIDFFTIKEDRNGGNKQAYPLHEREVAEALTHDLKTVAVTYEQFVRDYDLLSLYASGQFLKRDSYYGANYSLSDYGYSKDKTFNMGTQYKANLGKSSLIAGFDHTRSFLVDQKLGYPDYENSTIVDNEIINVPHTSNITVSDQSSIISGLFAQYEFEFDKTKIAIGGRYDHYEIEDRAKSGSEIKRGNVFSPRISLMHEIVKELQARISYSQGYRAPQIFDEDLHIETSGSRQVLHENDPDLKQETSNSYMLSFDYNGLIGTVYTGILLEGFHTRLSDPFVNEIGMPDEAGTVVYTRKNASDGATVQGVNVEFKLKPLKAFSLTSGFTVQSSKYDVVQEFNEKNFFRTPNKYGYLAIDWDFEDHFCFSVSANYTGAMLVPYFGTNTNPDIGELRKSGDFIELGFKLDYTIKLNGASVQFFAGVKNIFNAYQSDFDIGINRDPAYMYGPVNPRTVYFGIKFGNLLTQK